MVRVYSYNEERKGSGFSDIYFIAGAFGIFFALFFIVGGIGLGHIIRFFVKQWAWVVGFIGGIILLRTFIFKSKRKISPTNYPSYSGQEGL